jgi:hypothetical protein
MQILYPSAHPFLARLTALRYPSIVIEHSQCSHALILFFVNFNLMLPIKISPKPYKTLSFLHYQISLIKITTRTVFVCTSKSPKSLFRKPILIRITSTCWTFLQFRAFMLPLCFHLLISENLLLAL